MLLDDLFSDAEKIDSLFVVHNEAETKMTAKEIFDAKKFTDFKGVSYVSSPKFFAETYRKIFSKKNSDKFFLDEVIFL